LLESLHTLRRERRLLAIAHRVKCCDLVALEHIGPEGTPIFEALSQDLVESVPLFKAARGASARLTQQLAAGSGHSATRSNNARRDSENAQVEYSLGS